MLRAMLHKKNKVVLVNPGVHYQDIVDYGVYPNTAIMVLSTILHQAGFQVTVIDGKYDTLKKSVEKITDEIDEDVIFVGFSVMTVQLPWAYRASQFIKQKCPHAVIVWGGVHPTLFPEQTVEDKAVDIVVVNDAAATIAQLAARLSENSDLSEVPGIFYKTAQNVIQQTPPNLIRDDFSNIPNIDFSLIDHKRYSRNNNIATEEFYGDAYKDCLVYPIITGLGCSYKCSFCINVILRKSYRFRSAEQIVERIQYLNKNYGADFIDPHDENFFINRKRIFDLLDLMEKENIRIKWRPLLRADYFGDHYINVDLAKRLERSGMVVAAMGAESASQETLDRLNKQLKVENIHTAMDILTKTNIVPKMNFMVGLPGETMEDIKKTYQLAARLRESAKRSCVSVTIYRPYPGSPLYDQVVSEYNYVPPTSLDAWARLSEKEFFEGIGYESYEKYKWIENSSRLKAMQSAYIHIAWYRPKRDNGILGKTVHFIDFNRFRYNCFAFMFIENAIFRMLSVLKRLSMRIYRAVRYSGQG